MAYLAYQHRANGRSGFFSGYIWRIVENFAAAYRVFLPPVCSTILHPPSVENYGNRQYIVGGHTANLVIDEEFRCNKQGILPPTSPPTVAVGAGTTVQICYLRFFDSLTGERSPLSGGTTVTGDLTRAWTVLPTEVPGERILLDGTASYTAPGGVGTFSGTKTTFGHLRPGDRVLSSGDANRWTQVLSISTDALMTVDDAGMTVGGPYTLTAKTRSRVSHVELWVSVTGSLPRFIARLAIGTTSYTESTATLALGEAFLSSYEAMPFGSMNCFYNDRQLIAGVENHRDTVFLSAIGYPERHEGLSFITSYNEPIVGMFRYRDYVVLLCPDSSYRLQGYTEDDYSRTVLEPDIGGLGHLGNRIAEGKAFVPGRKGVQIFNGAFHPGLPTRRTEWSSDYLRWPNSYELGLGVVNPNDETYQFYPLNMGVSDPDTTTWPGFITTDFGQSSEKAHVWVGDYGAAGASPNGGFSAAEWTSDTHITSTGYVTAAAYLVPSGSKVGRLYRGDSEGYIYEEYEAGALRPIIDPAPALLAPWTSVIVPMHFINGDYGGDKQEGKKLIKLWSYVISEDTNWILRVWPGDEYAYPFGHSTYLLALFLGVNNEVLAGYVDNVPASFLDHTITSPPDPNADYKGTGATYLVLQKQSVHLHKIEGVPIAGRGFTMEFRFPSPNGVQFMGFGGVYEPGVVSRPVWVASVPPA